MKRFYFTIIALITVLSLSAQTINVFEYDDNGILNSVPSYTSSKKVKVIFTSTEFNKITSITLNKQSMSVNVGKTITLYATIEPEDAKDHSITWLSSNETIATVDANGKVTAISVGSVTISAIANDGSGVKASCILNIIPKVEIINAHEYVDLGLPSGTLWANCNIGANKPEEYGYYFAWGETSPKENYNWGTYKWMNTDQSSWSQINKYTLNDNQTRGCWYDEGIFIGDGKEELDTSDDAATINWGSSWCMPTSWQQYELINDKYTGIEWTTINGVKGCKITSLKNGNFIFLPASGYRYNETTIGLESSGMIWSRKLWAESDNAYLLDFNSNGAQAYARNARYFGLTIRAVRTPGSTDGEVKSITLNKDIVLMNIGDYETLTATIVPEDANNRTYTWISSDESIAEIDSNGKIMAISEGTVKITAIANDGSGVRASCRIIVYNPSNYKDNEYVDLGLPSGTLWATCNIGAERPEECGDYFAWGETNGYNSGKLSYNWANYKWYDREKSSAIVNCMTKYCTNYNLGSLDNKSILDPEDDAATVYWGINWCMPTKEQIRELRNPLYTKIQTSTLNGANGCLITSLKNGKSIFIPYAGERFGGLTNKDAVGCYWSRSLETGINEAAYSLSITEGNYDSRTDKRYKGLSIRAVRRTK